jgi:hypothetical protein
MRASLLCAAAFGLCTTAALPAAAELLTRDSVVDEQGVGPIRIGMTPEAAGKAAGINLLGDPHELYEDGSCYYVLPEGPLGEVFAFMVADGTIARVDVWVGSPATNAEGVRIGDGEQHLLQLYEGAVLEQHPYQGPEGHYVRTRDAGGQHGYIFETDGSKVENWRAGRYPEIEWIEGCL